MNEIAKAARPGVAVQSSSLAVLSSSAVVPVLVASLGDQASWRYTPVTR